MFSSDLIRAYVTCSEIVRQNAYIKQILKCSGCPTTDCNIFQDTIVKEPLLREMNFGILEGQAQSSPLVQSQLHNLFGKPDLTEEEQRSIRFPSGESYADVGNRAEKFLNQLLCLNIFQAQCPVPAHSLVVTHGIFLRELINSIQNLCGLPKFFAPAGNTGIYKLRLVVKINSSCDPEHIEDIRSKLQSVELEYLKQNDMTHLNDLLIDNLNGKSNSAVSDKSDQKVKTLDSYFSAPKPQKS